MIDIGVLGGGSWGTALARLLSNKGYNVSMYLRNKDQAKDIRQTRVNMKYLPGVKLPDNLRIVDEIDQAIVRKDLIVLSIPTHGIRDVLYENRDKFSSDTVLVNVAKGIENNSLKRISELVEEILPDNEYVILSGPSHAEEVGKDLPTTVVSASKNLKTAEYIQDVFMTPYFRVYTNTDVVGIELAGSLKNVIALGAGISDGLGYGDNTKAALMTRGIIEMSRLGSQMGANPSTFAGLAGIGDLIVTCTSMHSRNRRAGILIGQGNSVEETIEKVNMVVEGIKTTRSAYELAKKHQVSMPITEEIYDVIYRDGNVKEAVINLMLRDKKPEIEI